MNRKEFLKGLGIGGLGLGSFFNLESFQEGPKSLDLSNVSWSDIASDFKVLKHKAYMNNGTMGINPNVVLHEINKAFYKVAKTGNDPHNSTLLKEKIAGLLGVEMETIAITKNVTEGINIACWGIDLKKGDEVLMTKHEHVGGGAAWLYRAYKEGIVIKTFDLGKTAEETFQNYKNAITKNTKVVAVPHIPCTIGQILPVNEICKYTRSKDIISVIDGAHPLGMIRVNIEEIGCDYYAGCLHKWLLGPLGMGFVYIRPEKLESTKIHNIGAYGLGSFDMTKEPLEAKNLVDSSQRFSTGTYSSPLYQAGIRAIDWYEAIGVERIEKRVKALSKVFQDELASYREEIRILSPIEEISRSAITSFEFRTNSGKEFVNKLNYGGKFRLRHVSEAGLDAVRVSTHYYNNEEQIDSLIREVAAFLRN